MVCSVSLLASLDSDDLEEVVNSAASGDLDVKDLLFAVNVDAHNDTTMTADGEAPSGAPSDDDPEIQGRDEHEDDCTAGCKSFLHARDEHVVQCDGKQAAMFAHYLRSSYPRLSYSLWNDVQVELDVRLGT